jgi:hypothetical protein
MAQKKNDFLAEYEQVKDRLPLFFDLHPEARLTSELVWVAEDGSAVITLTKIYRNLEEQIAGCPFVTGLAREESGGMISAFVENAETSSIGRALANRNIYGAKGRRTGNRPSREEMESVESQKTLSDVARAENLREVPPEDYSEFEEVIAPPKRSAPPRRTGRSQTMIDSGKDDLQAFAVPDTFKCVHSDFCAGDTFLKQEVAKRGPRVGQEIVVCRKNGDEMEAARGDGKQWCNAEWNREEFLSMSKREETEWDNGSKDS